MFQSKLSVTTAKRRNVNDLAENMRLLSLRSRVNQSPIVDPHFVDKNYSLFSLPLELRRNVYKYLFNRGTAIVIDEDGSCVSTARMSTQLLRICKAICNEFAAMLFSSCIIATEHPSDLGKCFQNIGDLARRFVQEISISISKDCVLPLFLRRDRRGKAKLRKQSSICDHPLQHLSSLKKVKLRSARDFPNAHNHGRDVEDFVRSVLQSQPDNYNILNEHMCLCSDDTNVTWEIELRAEWTEYVGHPAPVATRTVTKCFEMETHFEFKFKTAVNNVDQPPEGRWQFKELGAAGVTDAEEKGWSDVVTLWRREVQVLPVLTTSTAYADMNCYRLKPSVPWEPSELKAPV